MLAITGKNDRTAAIIIFDSGLSRPNQALNSGANAMIGMAPAATASGSMTARIPAQREAMNATATPALTPMMNPPTASMTVWRAESHSGKRTSSQLSIRAVRIADGAGRMKARSCRLRTIPSQSTSPATAITHRGQVLADGTRRAPGDASPGIRGGAPDGAGGGAHPTAPSARVRRATAAAASSSVPWPPARSASRTSVISAK